MNKFFVTNEIYEDRMAICKACVYYSKTLGNCTVCKCFMKMITLYNVIHNTNYATGTNCGSCIATCFDGIRKLYNKYND